MMARDRLLRPDLLGSLDGLSRPPWSASVAPPSASGKNQIRHEILGKPASRDKELSA
jgi:hypothetical protein